MRSRIELTVPGVLLALAFVAPAAAQDAEPESETPWYSQREGGGPEGEPATTPADDPEPAPEPAPRPAPAPGPAADPEPDEPAEEAVDAEPDDDEDRWDLRPIGFIRAGYEYVFDDARYDFVGDNSGFILGNARVGVGGRSERHGIRFRVTIDGAVGMGGLTNTPEADLGVALRDAFVRWDFLEFLGVTVGQFKVPFMQGWLGRDGALPFASRPVGLDGVRVGRGFEQSGIVVDRELGLTLGSDGPVFLAGDFGIGYYVTAFNGNGINELLNDNVRPAVAGRFELYWGRWVTAGGGVLWNSRTEGPLPDQFDEEDVGVTADLAVDVVGIEFVGHFTLMNTRFPTTGNADRQRLEFHLQAGYDLPFVEFPFVIGYRFAYYDPWQSGGMGGPPNLGAFELMYHTVGLRVEHPVEALRLTAWLNYTFTVETELRSLDNDRIEVIVQAAF